MFSWSWCGPLSKIILKTIVLFSDIVFYIAYVGISQFLIPKSCLTINVIRKQYEWFQTRRTLTFYIPFLVLMTSLGFIINWIHIFHWKWHPFFGHWWAMKDIILIQWAPSCTLFICNFWVGTKCFQFIIPRINWRKVWFWSWHWCKTSILCIPTCPKGGN